MKFNIRLSDLEEQPSELLNEAWFKLGSELIQQAGKLTGIGVRAARMIGKIPLGSNATDTAVKFAETLQNLRGGDAVAARLGEAVEAAMKVSKDSGKPVSFGFDLAGGNSPKIAVAVNPDGISTVRRASSGRNADKALGSSAETTAAARYDYDAATPGAGAGAAARSADDAAEAGAKLGDEALEGGEEAAGAATRSAGDSDYESQVKEFTRRIQNYIDEGKVAQLSDDAIEEAFNARRYKVLDDAVEAGVVKLDAAGNLIDDVVEIPLTIERVDDAGNLTRHLVVDSKGRTVYAQFKKGPMTPRKIIGSPAGDAVAWFDDLTKAVAKIDTQIYSQLDTLPEIWRRARQRGLRSPSAWWDLIKESGASLGSKIAQEFNQWYMPFSSVKGLTKKVLISGDLLFSGGFLKAVPAFGSAVLRFLGIARRVGSGGTATFATGLYLIQGVAFISTVAYALANWHKQTIKKEEELYDLATASDDLQVKIDYIAILNDFFKRRGLKTLDPTPDQLQSPVMLQNMVEEAHDLYLSATARARGQSWDQKTARFFEDPLDAFSVPGDLMDVVQWMSQENNKATDIDPEERKNDEKEQEGLRDSIASMTRSAREEIQSLWNETAIDEEAGRRDAKKYAVGERKPEPAAEVEPEKTQAPVSPPKKAAQAADATDIGDFEGLDDALFEIFNVDKPISIKVKSSSPRLRAKITEKK